MNRLQLMNRKLFPISYVIIASIKQKSIKNKLLQTYKIDVYDTTFMNTCM